MNLFNIHSITLPKEFGELEVIELGGFFEHKTKKLHIPVTRNQTGNKFNLIKNRNGNYVLKETIKPENDDWLIHMRLKCKDLSLFDKVGLFVHSDSIDLLQDIIGYKKSEFNYYESGDINFMQYIDHLFTIKKEGTFMTINSSMSDIMYFYAGTKIKMFKTLQELNIFLKSINKDELNDSFMNIISILKK